MKAQTAKTDWKEPKIYDKNSNMLVPYYLMYSYLYYEKDSPIVTDAEYDTILGDPFFVNQFKLSKFLISCTKTS